MFTNNWYTYFKVLFSRPDTDAVCPEYTVKTYKGYTKNPTADDGCIQYLIPGCSMYARILASREGSDGIYFGDGNVAPTKEDYYLSGKYISGLKAASITSVRSVSGDTETLSNTYVLTNQNTEPVTISEVAWVVIMKHTDSSQSDYFMVDRTLLDSPVTIPAGGQGVVVYKRSITLPTT